LPAAWIEKFLHFGARGGVAKDHRGGKRHNE
jgi:hypothetical protein